jgi:hypothetical protein
MASAKSPSALAIDGGAGQRVALMQEGGSPVGAILQGRSGTFALNASSQAVTAGTFTQITNWTTQFDTSSTGAFDPVAGTFRCPNAGIYLVSAALLFNVGAILANTNFFCIVKQNASLVFDGEYPVQAAGTSNLQTQCSGLVKANAGDVLSVNAFWGIGVGAVGLSPASISNYFAIAQLI